MNSEFTWPAVTGRLIYLRIIYPDHVGLPEAAVFRQRITRVFPHLYNSSFVHLQNFILSVMTLKALSTMLIHFILPVYCGHGPRRGSGFKLFRAETATYTLSILHVYVHEEQYRHQQASFLFYRAPASDISG